MWYETQVYRGFLVWLHAVSVIACLASAMRVTFWPQPGKFAELAMPFWVIPASMIAVAVVGTIYGVDHYQRWREGRADHSS